MKGTRELRKEAKTYVGKEATMGLYDDYMNMPFERRVKVLKTKVKKEKWYGGFDEKGKPVVQAVVPMAYALVKDMDSKYLKPIWTPLESLKF